MGPFTFELGIQELAAAIASVDAAIVSVDAAVATVDATLVAGFASVDATLVAQIATLAALLASTNGYLSNLYTSVGVISTNVGLVVNQLVKSNDLATTSNSLTTTTNSILGDTSALLTSQLTSVNSILASLNDYSQQILAALQPNESTTRIGVFIPTGGTMSLFGNFEPIGDVFLNLVSSRDQYLAFNVPLYWVSNSGAEGRFIMAPPIGRTYESLLPLPRTIRISESSFPNELFQQPWEFLGCSL